MRDEPGSQLVGRLLGQVAPPLALLAVVSLAHVHPEGVAASGIAWDLAACCGEGVSIESVGRRVGVWLLLVRLWIPVGE